MITKGITLKKRTVVLVAVLAVISAAVIAVGIYFGLKYFNKEDSLSDHVNTDVSDLKNVNKEEPLSNRDNIEDGYLKAAVVTNGYACAGIGRDILMKGGSAVEAAIAALLCEGVVCPQSLGVGGGFIMNIYERKSGKSQILNSREMAPKAANSTMFGGNSTLSQIGGLAVAIPGELKGYWEAFKRYKSGNVEWGELLQPTIELCRNGITVTANLAKSLKSKEKVIKQNPSISEILINKDTNSVWKEGDKLKRPKLAETLELLKKEPNALYNGSLTDGFVKDIQDLGGIITKEDMANYRPEWKEPIVSKLKNNITLYTAALPGSGVLLALMLNVLNNFIPSDNSITNYQRITETFKHAYGKRTHLADPNFVPGLDEFVQQLTSDTYAENIRKNISDTMTSQDPTYYGAEVMMPEDHGTAHLCVLAPNGDAVAVTSTVNLLFGSKVRSVSTGIILNDEMDDFSAPNITNAFDVPPSANNFIEPGKRPLSSKSPSIFVDSNGEVRLVVGAAGGTKITTSTAQVAMNVLWFNKTIQEAISSPRFHHQLLPMVFQYEERISQDIVRGLEKIGHNTANIKIIDSSVTGIERRNGKIYASEDVRRGGATAGF